MRRWLATFLLAAAAAGAAADGLQPYIAEYEVRYGSLDVGQHRTELARDDERWVIESRTTARGFARLLASGTLVQRSVFTLDGGRVRPLHYRFNDGMERSRKDVALDFDWRNGRVTGTEEDGVAVAVAAEDGLQDAASIQAAVQLALRSGREPGTVRMIEKDKVKAYRYLRVRSEVLATPLGLLDTVVYRSEREGSDRHTLLWYAPALGWVNVQAEQWRGGKRGFATRITAFRPGVPPGPASPLRPSGA